MLTVIGDDDNDADGKDNDLWSREAFLVFNTDLQCGR